LLSIIIEAETISFTMKISDLQTPALLVEADLLEHNIATMSKALPGSKLRPHVKAHKCTSLAKAQAAAGHMGFTCATVKEMEGMAAAGLGEDLLLANEVIDATRLGKIEGRVTVAVDSEETIEAAAKGGVREILIDVNVGIPRCGCPPEEAGRLADLARSKGLEVRGVMGYEGHIVGLENREERKRLIGDSMNPLVKAHEEVGGDIVSAGGTGTYDINTWATEIQAGSYALMDTAYAKLDIPFEKALTVLGTVIHRSPAYAVANCGLKCFGMDHGNPEIDGGHQVWYLSDEHISFTPNSEVKIGDLIRVFPAHTDPTVAYHEKIHVVRGDEVLDVWPVDLRGW
jgi:D-serine deaminase-like pyridoxal phosphate-dependent protein